MRVANGARRAILGPGVEKHIADGRPGRQTGSDAARARSSKPTVDGERQIVLFDRS